MRLGFVVARWGAAAGTSGQALGLARGLVALGHAVRVWAGRADLGCEPGIDVVDLGVRAGGLRGRLALRRAAARIDRAGVDVVIGFDRTPGCDVLRAGGGVHATWLEVAGWRRWSPLEQLEARHDLDALRSARVVVCNSEMVARDVRARVSDSLSKVCVLRNGVDAQRFRPDPALRATARRAWDVPDGGRVALFLGSGFRRKNLGVAATAFARVAGPADRLVVIGGDSRAAARLADAREVTSGRLVAMGPVADPERWIPGTDAAILPTRYDPSANATLEALACGVPAVTSGRDGAAEVVPDARLVVADPGDAVGFAAALGYAWERGGTGCREAALPWTFARAAAELAEIAATVR